MRGRAGIAVASVAAIATVAVGALLTSRSDASLTPAGNCAVLATVNPGKVKIDPSEGDGPFTIPLEGRVNWAARVLTEPPVEPRPYRGGLEVVGPGGVDDILSGLFEFRSWSSDRSRKLTAGGIERYELPSWTPRGVDIPIHGFQVDPLGSCEGDILVTVEGGRFESPLAWVAVGGTFFWLAVMLLAGKLRDEQQGLFCVGIAFPAFFLGWLLAVARSSTFGTAFVWGLVLAGIALAASLALNGRPWAADFWGGHPALGWFGGASFGFFLSLDLFLFGIVRLDSSLLLYPPILGIVAGLVIAWWTPFRGRGFA